MNTVQTTTESKTIAADTASAGKSGARTLPAMPRIPSRKFFRH